MRVYTKSRIYYAINLETMCNFLTRILQDFRNNDAHALTVGSII